MYEYLLKTYAPNKKNALGENTEKFFNSLPKKVESSFDLHEMIKSSKKFDNDTILEYPEGLSEKSYSDISIGNYNAKMLYESKDSPTLVVFYGGGFCLNMLKAHMSFSAHVFKNTSCNILIPEYQLAPECKADKTIFDSCLFLEDLIKNKKLNIKNNLHLLGWSSGANLALSVALESKKNKIIYQSINSLILLSSWIDLSMDVNTNSPYKNEQNKDIFAADHTILSKLAHLYIPKDQNFDRYNPLINYSKILSTLPNIHIICGEFDILLSDSIYLADTLKRNNVKTSLTLLKGQTHNYPVFKQIQDGFPAEKIISDVIGRNGKINTQFEII